QSGLVTLWATCACAHVVFSLEGSAPTEIYTFPTRRSSDLDLCAGQPCAGVAGGLTLVVVGVGMDDQAAADDVERIALAYVDAARSEEHTSELQSRENLVCRLLLEKKKRAHRRLRERHAQVQ